MTGRYRATIRICIISIKLMLGFEGKTDNKNFQDKV